MKRFALATMFALASVMTLGMPAAAEAQGNGNGNGNGNNAALEIPIVGTGPGTAFDGTFVLRRFIATPDGVAAVGRLVGTVTDTATGVVRSIVRNVVLPVDVGDTTCEILHLDLGPLDLNLLGLQVNLSQIVLDITAEAGPGNLLGNLLCGVAGLLDNPSGLARLLNQILSVLA